MIPQTGKASGAGIKILTPNKLLTRLSILLAQNKQFIQCEKWKQKNTLSFLSTE